MDIKDLNQKYLESLKYTSDLESRLNYQNKEVQRLQYLTNFMIVNQKKREQMIGHLFEENRKLKQILNTMQTNTPTNNCSITLKGIPINKTPYEKKNSIVSQDFSQKNSPLFVNLKEKKERGSQLPIENEISTTSQINTRRSLKKSQSRAYRIFDENVSHHHILNMNLSSKAEKLLYEDNEYVVALKPILEEQDIFIDYVSSNDMNNLANLYDNLMGLFTEHKSLYGLIYRLKKIIKAANVMTASLILTESIEKIVDQTIEFLECDRATVFILDEKKEELWSKVAKGSDFTIKIPMDKGVVGNVVMTGKSVNIVDAYADDRFNKEVDLKSNYRTKSILCTPIMDISNRVTGAIQAINKINGSFSKDDEGLLEILANIAGVILRNSLHFDEQLLFQNNLRHILKTGISLNSFFSYEKLIPNAEKVLKNIMNVDQSIIYLINKEEKSLVHFSENQTQFFDLRIGIAGDVAKKKEMANISNAYSHPLFNGQIDIDTTLPIICMPIIQSEGKEILGVFEVLNPKGLQGSLMKQVSKINGVEFEILQFFRQQLAQIINNIQEWEKVRGVNSLLRKSHG